MSFANVIWLVFILLTLQPMIRQWMLASARLSVIRRLERKRGTRVIALIHRQETLAFLGFPLARYIDINDSEEVLRAIKLTDPEVPIDLVLHTPGGLVLASEQIAHALCCRAAPTTVFVPHYAMSGGTLIALAAQQIVMDDNAVLGPVDPQLGQYPAASILSAVARKDANKIDDETLILADIAQKALRQVKQTVKQIVGKRLPEEQAEALAEKLAGGTWTHDYPISVEEAKEMGLPISTDVPREVYELMALYQQTSQRRPSVEYIPLPYPHRESERPGRAPRGA
ncbi:MAG: SDH family Clp fold serine proteinase [Anaerolineae bacterium]